jgi:regulator of replication initiation timing/transcriptional regulator with XRE-family HTH domain
MGKEIPPSKRLEVVKLYFEGFPYDDIARKAGVAKGSVAAIVEELRSGKFPQFENVAGVVNELRDLAVGLRKAGLATAEAGLLFIVAKRFIGLGVEPTQFESWVRMCQALPEGEFTRSQVIQAATKLTKLEQEGMTYEQTLERLASLSTQLKRLEEKLTELSAEEKKLRGNKEELRQTNISLQAENVRLQRHMDSVVTKTKQAERRCRDLEEMSKRYQATVDQLETRKGELVARTNQLEAKALGLEREITNRAEVLRNLDKVGFSPGDLDKLRARLNEIAEKHGKEETPNIFLGYLETYDDLLRMEAIHQQLTREVKSLTEQKEALDRLSEKLGLTLEQIAQGVGVIKSLRRKGVSPVTILSYQRTLTAAGLAPDSLEKLVKEFGGVEKALSARKSELKQRVGELEQKGRALEELKAQLDKVKESISTLRDAGMKQIKSIMSSAIGEVQRLQGELRNDLAEWGDMRGEMGKFKEELRLARYFAKLPVSDEALSELVKDLATTVVIQYLTIALVWCRERFNPKLKPPRVITKKYYGISEYTEFELADILTWALFTLVEGVNSGTE